MGYLMGSLSPAWEYRKSRQVRNFDGTPFLTQLVPGHERLVASGVG